MERYFSPILLLLFFLLSVSAPAAGEKAAAKVGDTTITETELEEALDSYKPPGTYHDVSRKMRDKFRKDALNDLIEIELLYKEAHKRGLKVSGDDVDKVVEANIKRLGSKKRLNEELRRQGTSMDDFREKIKKHQMVIALLNDLAREADYKEDELRQYYEANKPRFRRPEGIHLYHILIKVEPGATEPEWEKRRVYAGEILAKIKAGEDFGNVAYDYSEDPYKFKSGDLGLVHRGQLDPKELEDAAFSLKEGEMSGIIRTIYGFHILKAGEKKPEEDLSFDNVRDKIRKELAGKRFEEKKKYLLERLRKEHHVAVYMKFEDEGK